MLAWITAIEQRSLPAAGIVGTKRRLASVEMTMRTNLMLGNLWSLVWTSEDGAGVALQG